MRAEVFSKRIVKRLKQIFPEKEFFLPKKHFAFGKLIAKNNNTIDNGCSTMGGAVVWSYHVAPIVRLNDGKLYILDPALSGDAIEKEKWYGLMSENPESKITGYVTCEHGTYFQHSLCFEPASVSLEYLEGQIQGFLTM